MKAIELQGFNDFLQQWKNHFPAPAPDDSNYYSEVLFRGLPSSRWELSTTLERYGVKKCSIPDYIEYVTRCIPELASYLGRDLMCNSNSGIYKSWREVAKDRKLFNLLVEMRHFGFPSPLLDWTESPYIAAFFAFRHENSGDQVAIYAFMEHAGRGKSSWGGEPKIDTVGPFIETTDRHHIQQAQYSICRIENDANGADVFVPHLSAFSECDSEQDIIIKFLLPRQARAQVLAELQLMNINSYTLFRNTEGLCEHLSRKHFLWRE